MYARAEYNFVSSYLSYYFNNYMIQWFFCVVADEMRYPYWRFITCYGTFGSVSCILLNKSPMLLRGISAPNCIAVTVVIETFLPSVLGYIFQNSDECNKGSGGFFGYLGDLYTVYIVI
jgi:hypothetical protein